MFMTKTELESMTGLVRSKAQARWLHANGIPVLFRADGTLLVLKSAVEVKLGGTSTKIARSAQPHWDALNAQKTKEKPKNKWLNDRGPLNAFLAFASYGGKRPGWMVDLPIPAKSDCDEYHKYRLLATPRWLTHEQRMQMRALYKQAAGTRNGKMVSMSVDHIVPLKGRDVCGLHVPWNLQLIPLSQNQRKNNKHSVDHEDT